VRYQAALRPDMMLDKLHSNRFFKGRDFGPFGALFSGVGKRAFPFP